MKPVSILNLVFLFGFGTLFAQRQDQILNENWKFIRNDVPLESPTKDWMDVNLPHTWNTLDGQDYHTPGGVARPNERGSDYFRGIGWYARTIEISKKARSHRIFLVFEAASQVAKVYFNGTLLGDHRGSFTAFAFEVTPLLHLGEANEVRVQVDNSLVPTIPPLAGDFNVDGGLYRSVHLLETDSVCITPLDNAGPGVYLTIKNLDGKAAEVEVRTIISNGQPSSSSATVLTEITNAAGMVVASSREDQALAATEPLHTTTQTLRIPNPHLWNGRFDPYLYHATVRVLHDNRVIDEVVQPLGLRTVAITDEGFMLNGKPYSIFGVCRHQDLRDHGWALQPSDDERDLKMISEMGATAVRLAHYPQNEGIHQIADQTGLLLWNEVPFVNDVPDRTEEPYAPSAQTQAFSANLEQQLREMIVQRYNHPSVAWWGLFNEIRPNPTSRVALPIVQRLNALAHSLDPTRPTVAASDKLTNPTNFVSDSLAYNVYPGWYTGSGALGELAKIIDERFAEKKGHRIGISEYGAGGNPTQHVEGAVQKPIANNGPVHPEEWQSLMHERDWAQMANNPKLWGSFIWVMFDFSSDGREEGGVPGINDKGLVTQDRSTRKDSFFFYQANWSHQPMVHITSSRMVSRHQPKTEIKVYSNCGDVELSVNRKSLGRRSPDEIHIARWEDVSLSPGKNTIETVGFFADGQETRDRCEWTLDAQAGN